MTTSVVHYHKDGANRQVQATLAMFQFRLCDGIEASWSDDWKNYEADITVARWENCREQGYVLSLNSSGYRRQLNIAFFEHRNSDEICAVRWEQKTINAPTINTIDKDAYKTKWDITHSEDFGEVLNMAEWMLKEFEDFWAATVDKK